MDSKYVLLWIFATVFSIEAATLGLYDGDSCALHSGPSGVCKLISACEWLRDQLGNKSMTHSQIVHCGFKGTDPIVCCKDDGPLPVNEMNPTTQLTHLNITSSGTGGSTNSPSRFSQGKSAEACMEYTRMETPLLSDRILEGQGAMLNEFPHMVALGYPNAEGEHDFQCGGTLISDQWVVTAAHCIRKNQSPTLIRMGNVWLGEDDVFSVDRAVTVIVRHPSYSAADKGNDIALIKLDKPVQFNDRVRPACMRTQIEDVSETTKLIIAGWGVVDAKNRKRLSALQKTYVTIVPLDSCNATLLEYNQQANIRSLRNGLLDSHLCTRDASSPSDKIKDACAGDSGGPVFTVDASGVSTIVGIISFGIGCGTRLPSISTRIASYTDWIESAVWPK